ncbi:MAG: TauD/TfdA family dioxygenase [Thermoanaerobaculia bacterium]
MQKPLPSFGDQGPARRAVTLSAQELVSFEPFPALNGPLLAARPAVPGVDLAAWIGSHREPIAERLLRHGGILFRGFGPRSVADFERLTAAFGADLLEYSYRSTPRSQVSDRIYTSTEYPADQYIPMHNEMSYTSSWPLKIWFFCAQPAASGGATPVADSRRVYERIRPPVRERFERLGVLYQRNFGHELDLPWESVFQTADRAAVEELCRAAGLEFEWKAGNRLRTRQVCPAVARHPRTGEPVWFNQAHLFHVSSLQPEVREALLAEFAEEELPRNTYYGDGAPIEEEVLEEVREAYRLEAVTFPWEQGDLLMLDNMLMAHGREPFTGPRKILVGMAEPITDLR